MTAVEISKTMKKITCLFLLIVGSLTAAAPESVRGKVFRTYHLFSGVTNASESTVLLGTDGRFTVLKSAFGVKERPGPSDVLPEVHWGAIQDPPAGGTFSYQKTDEMVGILTFFRENAPTGSITLRFNSSSSGSTDQLPSLAGNFFYFTELSWRDTAALSNVSLRGHVSEGRPVIMGFSVPGTFEREVLIRVIGPSLAAFGVSGVWNSASMQIFKGDSAVFGAAFRFPHWSVVPVGIFPNIAPSPEVGLRRIFDHTGAFQLPSGSRDCAIVIRLAPGNYTVVAGGAAGDAGGEALIELYTLP